MPLRDKAAVSDFTALALSGFFFLNIICLPNKKVRSCYLQRKDGVVYIIYPFNKSRFFTFTILRDYLILYI